MDVLEGRANGDAHMFRWRPRHGSDVKGTAERAFDARGPQDLSTLRMATQQELAAFNTVTTVDESCGGGNGGSSSGGAPAKL